MIMGQNKCLGSKIFRQENNMSIRSTLLACMTILACIALLIAYVHKNTRYEMVGGQNGIYLFDRQTTLIHHCDQEKCKLLSPDGSSVEAMRALAGIPSVDLIRKEQAQTCIAPEKKPEQNYANINISSLQSITDPMPSMTELKANSPNTLGMGTVNQQVQKPQNPFPEQNNGVPAPQTAPQQADEGSSSAENTQSAPLGNNPYEEAPSSNTASPTTPYPGTSDNTSSPETKAINNPYGEAASGNNSPETKAINNPYGEAASNGSTASPAPYPAG
jgi:hypothetical protein